MVCTNTEQADIHIELGGRHWSVLGTGHAEVGLRGNRGTGYQGRDASMSFLLDPPLLFVCGVLHRATPARGPCRDAAEAAALGVFFGASFAVPQQKFRARDAVAPFAHRTAAITWNSGVFSVDVACAERLPARDGRCHLRNVSVLHRFLGRRLGRRI